MELAWIASSSSSALYAAGAVLSGYPLADPRLTQAMHEPTLHLRQALAPCGERAGPLWNHLLALSAGIESNQQLVELATRKALGPGTGPSTSLVAAITQVEHAVRGLLPRLADDLVLRGKPLREQWEARGPGLLFKLAQLTDESICAPSAQVVLVHPALGGGGTAHLTYNLVHIEAVLANPFANLPEVVRLAWLLAQLHLELPRFSEQVPPGQLPRIAGLAMVPPTLEAAQFVELGGPVDESAIRTALQVWERNDAPEPLAEIVWHWWQTYREDRPPFSLGLRALAHMLAEAETT